ncbi:hypothetical protein DICPUDRAFT_98253 [Dictyostelium purpureum]|uniref:N-acetyltransferase domain-containing protein n=1 Tax=Dictyostelium purpureum TaxID=5786 RepID=F0ZNY2_DICPU|nr:uncharacterized protein DICPUDRAFT_98253 [Dictyostelium purpureum]EGC34343.1 hypothetical protein DICPUDRAFT_98253 [Dictyostelium purpureum]|eukprot:XP_003289136.1 hypothetical protein DICPUDRAFT_98253 [Dictyostelium purpureum]
MSTAPNKNNNNNDTPKMNDKNDINDNIDINDQNDIEVEEDEWAFVDLWDNNIDQQNLLERFWNDLIKTTSNTSDMQTLSDWNKAMSPESQNNPDIPDLHILLAFKASDLETIKNSTDTFKSPPHNIYNNYNYNNNNNNNINNNNNGKTTSPSSSSSSVSSNTTTTISNNNLSTPPILVTTSNSINIPTKLSTPNVSNSSAPFYTGSNNNITTNDDLELSSSSSSGSSFSSIISPSPISYITTNTMISSSPSSTGDILMRPGGKVTPPQILNNSSQVIAGVIFEYYPNINCGLFLHMIIQKKHRNMGLEGLLVKRAIEILDRNAHSHGHLAGCNAIFFETKSAVNSGIPHQSSDPNQIDPRQQHSILHKIGFRLVDFDYTKLPLVRLGKSTNLLLTVYLSPHIPSQSSLDGDKYYLPSVLLKNFIYDLWDTSYLNSKVSKKPDEDPEYGRALEQIELREKIPLLDLPWGAGKPWTLVDLYEDYDEELLERCYREFMVPSVKHSEIPSLGNVLRAMSPEGEDSSYLPDVHVLLAVRWPADFSKDGGNSQPIIDGLCVFEYHTEQNCGILTHLILQKKNRASEGLDSLLVDSAVEILDTNARERGNLAGCNAIFLHIKNPSQTVSPDVVDICQHHMLLYKMGFKLLDFDYYIPPLDSITSPKKMMLGLFITPLIPKSNEKGDRPFIPSNLLKQFVELQWDNAFGSEQIKNSPNTYLEYQRMIEQIELRERIPLLDLPWDSGKPWTLVDLWEDYDRELLERFYKEIMIPNFPNKYELEPLENWIQAFSSEIRDDPNISDLHILLALRWSDSSTQPIIEGVIIFEYFSANNCGLLTYLIVQKTFKGKGLDRILVESAIEILNQNAKSQGFLPGCNAIFLEVYSGEKVTIKQDVVDPRMRHSIYHQIGFRLIDFEYIAPPLSITYPKLKHFLLTVYLTEHIPKMPLEDGKYYLPSSVLKNFITVLWKNAYATNKIKHQPQVDGDFTRMIEQFEYREKVPLLDLPWGASKPWTLVDLRDDYDEDLMVRFYNELMLPNFPMKNELEPLSNFISALSEERRESYNPHLSEVHVLLALRWPTDSFDLQPTIGAGIIFEYYSNTNCGLLSYLVVHRSSRGQGLAGILVERAVELLDKHAKTRGQLAGCNCIFLETNSAEKVTLQQDVMDPRMRHTIYYKMGFRMIDFEYIMPPLYAGFEKLRGVLLLTVYLTPHIPYQDVNGKKQYYLPNVLLKNFIGSQWENAYRNNRLSVLPNQDVDFTMSLDQLEIRERVPLLDLPWGDGKDWMIVDLWEDYDQELLDAFYKKYMITQFGTSDELEPLDNWHKALSDEGRDDPNICDLHVLLALGLPGEHKGKGHKYIIGGLVFEYYPETNTALVTYLVVNQRWSGKGIGTDLILRTLTILDQNAKQKGHIAGCNAIFLEVMFSPQSTINGPDSSLSHVFLFNKGFRLLDFEYYQPPTSLKNPKSNNVCLTVLLTPRIPKHGEGSEIQPFVPSSLLRSFITTLWEDECGLIGYNFEKDPCYLRMMNQLDNNEYFHCLDLPWIKHRIDPATLPISTDKSANSFENHINFSNSFNNLNISYSSPNPIHLNSKDHILNNNNNNSSLNNSGNNMIYNTNNNEQKEQSQPLTPNSQQQQQREPPLPTQPLTPKSQQQVVQQHLNNSSSSLTPTSTSLRASANNQRNYLNSSGGFVLNNLEKLDSSLGKSNSNNNLAGTYFSTSNENSGDQNVANNNVSVQKDKMKFSTPNSSAPSSPILSPQSLSSIILPSNAAPLSPALFPKLSNSSIVQKVTLDK